MSLNNSPHQSGLTKISLSSKDVPSRADEDEASPLAGKKYQDINQNHGEPSESGRSKRIPGILVGWGKEVLAAFGAVLALAALIAFLGVYNGRQRPQWPYAITINTVLSIFGIILKSCMLVPIAEGLQPDHRKPLGFLLTTSVSRTWPAEMDPLPKISSAGGH